MVSENAFQNHQKIKGCEFPEVVELLECACLNLKDVNPNVCPPKFSFLIIKTLSLGCNNSDLLVVLVSFCSSTSIIIWPLPPSKFEVLGLLASFDCIPNTQIQIHSS